MNTRRSGRASLADLLPSLAVALGHPGEPAAQVPLSFAPGESVVLVLLDGLGEHLLRQRSGHAPWLAKLSREIITCGFPATTVTSLAMLGTGLWPGVHGLVGTEVMDPERKVLFNELAWDSAVDPRRWQPHPTVFEDLHGQGVDVVSVGAAYFDGSGLTTAALRGGRFVAANSLADRVRVTARLVRQRPGPQLVYLYWGEIDKVGHVHGCQSWQWGEELSAADAALRRLVESLPAETEVVITADHGMVDIASSQRVDLADHRELAADLIVAGGDPRGLHLYCHPGKAEAVAKRWRDYFGTDIELRTREQAVAEGWFGPTEPRVLPRIGDLVVSIVADRAVVDSRRMRPEILALKGLHGGRTEAETLVPLIRTRGQA